MLGTGGVGGGGGRIFTSGIDRRLRTQHGNNHQQALKCPRCDSLNTKFCYYNNYNLSQPRHFCKGCRRYWTKGGVLRKVPVGGGCRKAKRTAKPKQPATTSAVVITPTNLDSDHKDNSSSESSSLTNTTTLTGGEVVSGNTNTSSKSGPTLFNFAPECNFFSGFIDQAPDGAGSMFPEIGGLMTSSEDMMTSSREVGFDIGEISTFVSEEGKRLEQVQQVQDMNSGGYLDQTAQIDSGIFDLTGAVDQTFWTQSQWPDHSAFHYLP